MAHLEHPSRVTPPPLLEPTDGVATVQGMPVVVPDAGRSSVSRRLMTTGVTEPRFTEVVGRLVMPGHRVLDVGANIGYFTCIMARRAGPAGRVIAFEPVERPRAYLRHNIGANGLGMVTVDARALSDWTGAGYVTLPKYRLERSVPEGASVALETGVARLDDVAGELSIDGADLVKIDIEGSEQRALAGMRSLLDRHRPTLAIEVHPEFLGHYGDSVDGLDALFAELGYAAVAIEPTGPGAGNYHVIAAPPERLRGARLVPDGAPEVRFALAGARDWSRGRRSVVGLWEDGDALELTFALHDGEKEYIVTSEHTTEVPPSDAGRRTLSGERYTELRWHASLTGTARCALWLFEYDRRRLVAKTSFPLTPGTQALPHVSAASARSFRLGFRLAGAGTVRLERLELIQA